MTPGSCWGPWGSGQRLLLAHLPRLPAGNDHLVMLTMDGDLFTCGCGEQGQLGRVPELFANRGGRKGLREWLWGSGTLVAAGSRLSFAEE